MTSVAIVAASAVSALGTGRSGFSVGEIGERPATAIAEDALLREAGLKRPYAARARLLDTDPIELRTGRDRAERMLGRVASELVLELDRNLSSWRERRLLLCVGTSAGGMQSAERVFAERERGRALEPGLARAATYFGPLATASARLGVPPERVIQVLAACASSSIAIGLACRLLELGEADLAVAGGYDALSVFVAAGFEALGATSASLPAPFRRQRDGMALGEGAALVALVLERDAASRAMGYVVGFGASSDAVHVTAPDRTGSGLITASKAALADAERDAGAIDLVSAHATATPFNDAAEARAMDCVLGQRLPEVVVHPFKATIGHTLGAAGVLESLSALDALERGVMPAALGSGPIEEQFRGRLLEVNAAGAARSCLKLSAAFGGANAALVFGKSSSSSGVRIRRPVRVASTGEPRRGLELEEVRARVVSDPARLSRLDPVSALAVAAAGSALANFRGELPERTGVVLGTAAATTEVNEVYDARRRRRGARSVEPRRFPATSPNLACGEVSIAFGLRGPSLASGAGLAAATEALVIAWTLLAAGDADALLVVAVEHVGPVVQDIWQAAGWPLPSVGAAGVLLVGGARGGQLIDPTRVFACHTEACGAFGQVGGAPAGWPSLLKGVEVCLAE